MKNCVYYIIAFLLLFVGCTRNELVIIDERLDAETDSVDKEKQIVHFYPFIDTDPYQFGSGTNGTTPFPKGNRAQIFVVVDGIQFLQWPLYQSLSAGTLSPVNQPVSIVNGRYYFYAVSLNSPEDPPTFHNGDAYPVNNGVDYLWDATMEEIIINNTAVPLLFQHCAAQLVIKVVNLDSPGIIDWINFAMVQEPDTANLKWNLYTGKIAQQTATGDLPSQSVQSSMINMPASGLMCSQFIVPLQYTGSLIAYLSLKMKNSTAVHGYDVELPVPSAGYVGGPA